MTSAPLRVHVPEDEHLGAVVEITVPASALAKGVTSPTVALRSRVVTERLRLEG